MKLILTFFLVLLLCAGGLALLAHHDTVRRADVNFRKFAPVTASFSRCRGDREHLVSIYWRLHFAGKKPPLREAVATWSLRPFRHVAFLTK